MGRCAYELVVSLWVCEGPHEKKSVGLYVCSEQHLVVVLTAIPQWHIYTQLITNRRRTCILRSLHASPTRAHVLEHRDIPRGTRLEVLGATLPRNDAGSYV